MVLNANACPVLYLGEWTRLKRPCHGNQLFESSFSGAFCQVWIDCIGVKIGQAKIFTGEIPGKKL